MQYSYREQLKQELSRRRKINPRFSLRSFARTLDVSPAFLSKVLQGKKHLSVEKATSVAKRLKYDTNEVAQFCHCVEREHRGESFRRVIEENETETLREDMMLLQLDAFQ